MRNNMVKDGDQDGCHNHYISGILLLKHIQLLHITSELNTPAALCLMLLYVVNIIIKIVLTFDTHIIYA